MVASSFALRSQGIALRGVVGRNVALARRYVWWELAFFVWVTANALTIVFIADGFAATSEVSDVARQTTILVIGVVIWSYLGIVFQMITETVAFERWEGTIEYTFMTPMRRAVHLLGVGGFALTYALARTALLFAAVSLFFGLELAGANFAIALLVLVVASVSFLGIGIATAVLPLVSPEKGAQLGFIAQGLLLVVSGIYYPISVLPEWMQWLSALSPATYAIDGIRAALLDGAGLGVVRDDILVLATMGLVAVPVGLVVFRAAERSAKRSGNLTRSG